MADHHKEKERVYSASRLSSFRNFFFRDQLKLEQDDAVFLKGHWVGDEEQKIRYDRISSVSMQRGFIFASLLLESTGGSEPVYLDGFWRWTAARAKADLQSRLHKGKKHKDDRMFRLLEEQNGLLRELLNEIRKSKTK